LPASGKPLPANPSSQVTHNVELSRKSAGVIRDYIMVLSFRQWLTRSSTLSEAVAPTQGKTLGVEAQFAKGLEFESGKGVVQDYAQAAHWYAQAAEQNHSLAQFNLAMLYGHGQGMVKDEAKSLMWLSRAAKLGNAAAQYRLGVHEHLASREGRIGATTEGRVEALKWVRLSAAQGYPAAQGACEFVALGMTWEEVAEGGRRAAAFVAG
jgi:TPR repeat protein